MTRHRTHKETAAPALTLAALIRREQDTTGASYNDIAKAAGLSKAKVGQLADASSRYQVRPETIDKLARGLRLPVAVVRRAALVTAGIADPTDDTNTGRIELLAHELGKLDATTLAIVEAMIHAAVTQTEGRRG